MYLLFDVNIFFGYFIDIVVIRVVEDRKIKKIRLFWVFIWSFDIKRYNDVNNFYNCIKFFIHEKKIYWASIFAIFFFLLLPKSKIVSKKGRFISFEGVSWKLNSFNIFSLSDMRNIISIRRLVFKSYNKMRTNLFATNKKMGWKSTNITRIWNRCRR